MLENKTTEFRREYSDGLKRTVVAFANTEGGKIYIGIGSGGTVCGVGNMQDTMLHITGMIREAIRPDITPFTECTVETMDGKLVVVLSVQRGTARPYFLTDKGIRPEGVYLRLGTSSVPASEAAILNMIRETGGDHYEDARSLEQQLTFEKTRRYFFRCGLDFGGGQKRALNIIGADQTYTNLGLLLSDQCPHTIKLAVFQGEQKNVFRDRREFTGPLLAQLEEVCSYLQQLGGAGPDRADRRDYPDEALREVLINAMLHRDYSFDSSTLISVFDDRLEVVDIGGLTRGLLFDDLQLGASALRNPKLVNVFSLLKLTEAHGTGILKISQSYADCPVKPQFEATDNAFRVTLPNRSHAAQQGQRPGDAPSVASPTVAAPAASPVTAPANTAAAAVEVPFQVPIQLPARPNPFRPKPADKPERREALLRLARSRGYIIRKDVETELKVSQPTAILILRDMLERGMLVREGFGKQQRYRSAE